MYPYGYNGYTFQVSSINSSNEFTVNVGPSTITHTYSSGGTANIYAVRPFDGQVVYFDELYKKVSKITVTNGGSGYTTAPEITIDSPTTSWGIPATATAEIKNGSVESIILISEGRGYESIPSISVSGPATASIEMIDDYYVVSKSTPISNGISTITVTANVPYAVGVGTAVPFYKQSRVLASSHAFEYVGSGTDPVTSLPSRGGVAIQENEVDNRAGGLVVYTSTDQTGNFRIGEGVQINQQEGTISGTFYSKSLFSTMTPFILALGGD